MEISSNAAPRGLQIENGVRTALRFSAPTLNLEGVGLEAADRFWANVAEVESGCWEWQGCKFWTGYGRFWLNGKDVTSHRASYEFSYGPIPQGLVVRHSCDNRVCVNPAHLSLGSHKDNTQDMVARGRSNLGKKFNRKLGVYKTHCKNGHLLNAENRRKTGGCCICHIERKRAARRAA